MVVKICQLSPKEHDGMPMVLAGKSTLGCQILQKGGNGYIQFISKGFEKIRLFRILPAPPGQEYYWKYSGELPGFHHREGLSGNRSDTI